MANNFSSVEELRNLLRSADLRRDEHLEDLSVLSTADDPSMARALRGRAQPGIAGAATGTSAGAGVDADTINNASRYSRDNAILPGNLTPRTGNRSHPGAADGDMRAKLNDSASQHSAGSPFSEDPRWKGAHGSALDSSDVSSVGLSADSSIVGGGVGRVGKGREGPGSGGTAARDRGDRDNLDYTVVHFGSSQCLLRGKTGLYLTAIAVTAPGHASGAGTDAAGSVSASSAQFPSHSFAAAGGAAGAGEVPAPHARAGATAGEGAARFYTLGVNGLGVGDKADCIVLINADNKEDTGPIRYGATVSLKAPAARERLLGLRDGARLGFWRNLLGQGEKWQLLKAAAGALPSSSGGGSRGAAGDVGMAAAGVRGCEDVSSRGMYVRMGDAVLVQTFRSDHLLSLHEALHGAEARLVYRDRAGLGSEVWRLDQFGSVPLPDWYAARPFLNGNYLAIPHAAKEPSVDAQNRAFPMSASLVQRQHQHQHQASQLGVAGGEGDGDPKEEVAATSLQQMPVAAQQRVLVREVLLALAGIEGQYVRVAAAADNANPPPHPSHAGVGAFPPAPPSEGAGVRTGAGGRGALRLSQVRFLIDLDCADRSTASQVMQLLPVCESAARVREFLRYQSRYEFGLVSHAMCAAVRAVVRQFDVLVAQLEHLFLAQQQQEQQLSLQKLAYLLQPSRATLRVLERLCVRVRDCVGGQLLDRLHGCLLEQGDARSRDLHVHLLHKAAEPFLHALSQWIFRGELHDTYKEFMVQEDSSLSKQALQDDFNAQWWDLRYTLCPAHIPTLLRAHAQKALTAGKYLNVVRDCGGGDMAMALRMLSSSSPAQRSQQHSGQQQEQEQEQQGADNQPVGAAGGKGGGDAEGEETPLELPEVRRLELGLELSDNRLAQSVEEAYVLSSRALLRLLESRGLRSHLLSLRRFFLLEHGDFFTQFMDTAEAELRREVGQVALPRVRALLQLAVQTSTLATDPNREGLSCSLASHNLIQHLHLIQSAGESGGAGASSLPHAQQQGLKGVEAFTLEYQVGWPLSIVISRRAVTKYQLLSRLLYFSKHVERRVLSSWQAHQHTKELNVRAAMGASYCLRHRMLHFLQNFVYYVTLEVIGPRGHELDEALRCAGDMDEVMELHERFLDQCLKECLLASQDLLRVLTKIMTTCLLFADQMQRFAALSSFTGEGSGAGAGTGSLRRSEENPLRRSVGSSGAGAGSAAAAAELQASLQQRQSRNREAADVIQREARHDSFARVLEKFATTFDQQLKEFLDKLWTNTHRHHMQLSNLCVRLDYNGFYSSQFADNVY